MESNIILVRDLFLIIFAVVLIFLRLFLQVSHHPNYLPGQTVKITATLTQEPQFTSWNQKLTIEGFSVSIPRWPEYHLGDRIEVIGTISKDIVYPNNSNLSNWSNLTNRLSLSSARVRLLPSHPNLFSLASLLRRRFESIYQSTLPEPAAGLMSGIVWGGRQNLSPALIESLTRTGTLHIVAASGMNVTMAAGFLLTVLLLFLRRRWAVHIGILAVIFYVLAAGFSASVVRAGIMAILFFLSQFFGRQYNTIRIFLITIFLMLIVKPLWLFDVGWQLSVAATAGLLFLYPRLTPQRHPESTRHPESANRRTKDLAPQRVAISPIRQIRPIGLIVFRRLWSFLAADFWVSVAALLATEPILLANFGNLSLLAPLVNALVLWLIGPLMVLGFLMGLGGPIATFLGWISYLLLSFFVTLIQFFGGLNWAVLEGWHLHWLLGLLYYLGLIYLFVPRKLHKSN